MGSISLKFHKLLQNFQMFVSICKNWLMTSAYSFCSWFPPHRYQRCRTLLLCSFFYFCYL